MHTAATPATIAHSEHLLAVVGPSGAGKDSVLRAWQALLLTSPGARSGLPHFARRVITRKADPHGEGHEAVEADTFDALNIAGAFALQWQAHGLHYGVRVLDLEPLKQGRWVVINASREHLAKLRAAAPAVRVVEITAPAPLRAQRLATRAREDAIAVRARLQREVRHAPADLVVHNTGDVQAAALHLHQWWEALN